MPRFFALALLLVAFNVARAADEPVPSFPTPPRLSLLDGQVSFWRPGAQEWAPAVLNTPLVSGDSLFTGPGANTEIQIGAHAYLRMGNSTQVEVSSIEPDYLQIKLTTGETSVDVRELAVGHTIEVDTPNAAFTIEHRGYYRVNVDQQSTSFITRRGGTASVTPAGQGTSLINASEEVVISGTDTPMLQNYAAPDLDPWDRWNYSRTDYLLDSISARYVPPQVYGTSDLDHSGSWRTVTEYGPVWVPYSVPPGWAPYSVGNWVYDPLFGWTWVDAAPWGYAPFHYGRWVYVGGYWGWAPGPFVARPVYAPALVAWYGGVHVGGGVGVGWVALGWGEPVAPWWGPPAFVGHPYWGGWGGPRVINNTVINNTTVVKNINVTNITYANAQYHNAVIATNSDRFGHRGHDFVRAAPEQVREWHSTAGGAEIRPSAASLVPGEGHATRPPQAVLDRPVVVLHAPNDPEARLHNAGLQPSEHAGPAPRIVSPGPRPSANERTLQQGREETRQQGVNGAPGIPEQRGRTQSSAAPQQTRTEPAAPTPARESTERSAPTERMRPPPPPGFNEWSKQQQARAPEGNARSAPTTAALPQNRGRPEGAGEQHKLPGEPAMKLRPRPSAPAQHQEGPRKE
jgi:hypothetical protein